MIEIKTLSELPDYAPILAFWSYMEWYRNRPIDFDIVLKEYKMRARDDLVPISYVAIKDSIPAGMVTLKMDDLWYRKDINPWLASLYVAPEFRNNGIGDMLISSVIGKAKDAGFNKIFLFLGQYEKIRLEEYYEKRGWEFYDISVDNDGGETKIFCYKLK